MDTITWAALLGRWTDFARSSLALPPGAEGEAWRASTAPIIALQAVTHALGELEELEPEERALGLDKAELLVAQHASEIHEAWAGQELPPILIEVVDDARSALAAALEGGVELILEDEMLVTGHPGEVVEALVSGGFDGDLLLPVPGRRLFEGSPVAFVRPARGGLVSDAILEFVAGFLDVEVSGQAVPEPRQVYRQFDFAKGEALRDFVAPMSADLAPGQPLLLWAIERGEALPVSLPARGADTTERPPLEFAPEAAGRGY